MRPSCSASPTTSGHWPTRSPRRCFAARSTATSRRSTTAWRQLLDRRAGVERIHDLFDGESRRRLDTPTLADLIVGQTERVELELAGDDETTWWRLRLRAIGGDGRAASFIGSLDDITTTAKLRVEARHDSLTGLLNRSAIEAHLAQALATSGSHTIVVSSSTSTASSGW
ncbi:MAG: GGDEF domain-containing protein [Acidimicrobiales bacterium]